MPAGKLLLVENSCFRKNRTREREEPLELRVWRMSPGEVRVTGRPEKNGYVGGWGAAWQFSLGNSLSAKISQEKIIKLNQ